MQVLGDSGYVKNDYMKRKYVIPDADVLDYRSVSFTNCFAPTAASDMHRGEVGFSISPAREAATGVVVVKGTVWIATDSPGLRWLTFQYENMEPSAMQGGAGGELKIRTLSNGVTALAGRKVIAPVVVHDRLPWRGRPIGTGDSVSQVDHLDGILVQAVSPDGTVYEAALGRLAGRLVRSVVGRENPMLGIRAWIASTPYAAGTDSVSWFLIPNVLPSEYTVRARNAELAESGVESELEAQAQVGDTAGSVATPSFPRYMGIAQQACGRSRTSAATALLLGAMPLDRMPPTWPVALGITWPRVGTGVVGRRTVSLEPHRQFRIGGVPRGRVLSNRVRRGAAGLLHSITIAPRSEVEVLMLNGNFPDSR